jgi:AcrR family transcriptional regulator
MNSIGSMTFPNHFLSSPTQCTACSRQASRLRQRLSPTQNEMVQMRRLKPASRTASKVQRLTQAERTAISDGRMLATAMALVLEHGTHSTTLREVGERAGYSRGLASNRFGSKEDLFAELIHVFNERWKKESSAFVGSKTGLEAFDAANESIIHFMNENSDYIRAMFIIYYETVGSSSLMRERLTEQHSAYRRAIGRYISQGIEEQTVKSNVVPSRVALQYTSFFFGLVYQWLANPDEIDFESALHDFRDAMVQVIGEPASVLRRIA